MKKEQKEYYKRFAQFAINCSKLASKLDWKVPGNKEWGKQLIKSSSSIGANFIEAIEGLSRKDFAHRYKICRKEATESIHWLYLIKVVNQALEGEIESLTQEAQEFVKMFSRAIQTTERRFK